PGPSGLPCTDDGLVMGYGGDGTISTNCGVAWATGHAVGGSPNEVVFTPSAPLVIPPNTPSACQLLFDLQTLGASNDTTPAVAEQVAGYEFPSDAQCDNGLQSGAFATGALQLCVCNDGDPCTTDSCDSSTRACTFTPGACPTTTTTSTSTTTTTL